LLITTLPGLAQVDKPILSETDSIYVIIKAIDVEGNEKTLDNVILAESKINVGDSITLNELAVELKKSKQNILNTRLFTEVKLLISDWSDNKITLNISVKERWYIYPIPIFELTGISFSEWVNEFDSDLDRVSYGMRVRHNNVRKRAERLEFTGKAGFQTQLGLGYTFTGIDKRRRWGLGFGANTFRNKGAVLSAENNNFNSQLFEERALEVTQASVFTTYRKVVNRQHGFGLSLRTANISDSVLLNSTNYFSNNSSRQSFVSAGYVINLEHRNLVEYPTEGYNILGNVRYEGIGSDGLDLFTTSLQASTYSKVGKKTFLSGSVNTRLIAGETIPFSNLASKRLDDELIRGYENYNLFPKSHFTLKSELRYRLIDKRFQKVPLLPKQFEPMPFQVFPKLFADGSRTSSDLFVEQNPLNDDLLYSIGVGADIIVLYNIPFRVEFSQNHLKENNLSFGIGKAF